MNTRYRISPGWTWSYRGSDGYPPVLHYWRRSPWRVSGAVLLALAVGVLLVWGCCY